LPAWRRLLCAIAPHNPQALFARGQLQIAASIPNFLIQERGTDTHEIFSKCVQAGKGLLPLPSGPGLGIESMKTS